MTSTRPRVSGFATILLGILVALAIPIGIVSAQSQDAVVTELDPTEGPAGTAVTVGVDRWDDDMDLQFGAWSVDVEHDASTDELSFEVPDVDAGEYYLVVRDDGIVVERYCCFTVTDGSDDADTGSDSASNEGTGSDDAGAAAQPPTEDCRERGVNLQCTEWGWVRMDGQKEIRGEPLPLQAEFQLNSNLAERDARWVLVSLRNVTGLDSEPVSFRLDGLRTEHGDVFTTEIDHETPNVLDMWIHVVDVPVGVPVTLDATVASSERGAYRAEVLILAFDRGYEPIKGSDGEDLSLFSFTLLGVNQATGENVLAGSGGGKLVNLPGPGLLVASSAILVALAAVRRWHR